MDYYDLGLSETVTPVLGTLTSSYGYRDHPVSGEYLFHAGVDLAAQTGTPVQAFAAGTVEYIGESDAYGLYIQVDHGNGVKTFYCHCSALYAQKGEQVALGQTIAAVGQTGNATGPHLHLEVKLDDVHLNPIYYVETAQG
jgi:murein DD-endopeptidase MepM/ murein hydrolase activator NlpD